VVWNQTCTISELACTIFLFFLLCFPFKIDPAYPSLGHSPRSSYLLLCGPQPFLPSGIVLWNFKIYSYLFLIPEQLSQNLWLWDPVINVSKLPKVGSTVQPWLKTTALFSHPHLRSQLLDISYFLLPLYWKEASLGHQKLLHSLISSLLSGLWLFNIYGLHDCWLYFLFGLPWPCSLLLHLRVLFYCYFLVSFTLSVSLCVLLEFLFLWQIPEKNNLKEERFILAHNFRSFSSWLLGSITFRPLARQKHHGGRKPFTSWQTESKGVTGKG
jgi:hypothetical protein